MFKKHEIKFKAHTLYLENYIDIGNGLYKCGCGIIFSSLWNAKLFPECPRCKTENTLVKSIEDISALMIEYNLTKHFEPIIREMSIALPGYDLFDEEKFPKLNQVFKKLKE